MVQQQQQATPFTQSQFRATPKFNTTPRFTNPVLQDQAQEQRSEKDDELISDDEFEEENVEEGKGIRPSIEDRGNEDIQDEENGGSDHDLYETEFRESSIKRRRLNSSSSIQDDIDFYISDQEEPPIIEEEGEEELLLEDENFEAENFQSSFSDIPSPSAPTPRYQTQTKPVPRFIVPSTPQSRFQTTMMNFPSTPISSNVNSNATASAITRFPTTMTHQIFAKPPRFRASSPDTEGKERSEPLPTTFSPRKKNSKYVVGGLANEVRSWILGIGDGEKSRSNELSTSTGTSSASRFKNDVSSNSMDMMTKTGLRQTNNESKGKWKMEVSIDEVKGGYGASEVGMMLVRGRRIISTSHSGPQPETVEMNHENNQQDNAKPHSTTEIKLALIGPPTPSAIDGSTDTSTDSINNISRNRGKKVSAGMKVGIAGPIWSIQLGNMDENEKEGWVVACSWGFL